MSEWNEVKADDCEIDSVAKEVFFYAGQNDYGSINVFLSFDEVKKLYKRVYPND